MSRLEGQAAEDAAGGGDTEGEAGPAARGLSGAVAGGVHGAFPADDRQQLGAHGWRSHPSEVSTGAVGAEVDQ